MYTVIYSKKSNKQLKNLDKKLRERIVDKINALAENPYATNNNVKALEGGEAYRLRVGDYRVVYYLHDNTLVIEVIRVKHRREAYQ